MIAKDYKIVKMHGYRKPYYYDLDGHSKLVVDKVLLYSLSLEGFRIYSEAATSNGTIIWVGRKHNVLSFVIVSFDIATEVFT